MTTTPYKPVSWDSEIINAEKLATMASNDQWLFENTPRIRYSVAGIVKDGGLKFIAGKSAFPKIGTQNFTYVSVYFGSFFSANCKPSITTGLEGLVTIGRSAVTLQGFSGNEIDHTGFIACISNDAYTSVDNGWVHWQAVGY